MEIFIWDVVAYIIGIFIVDLLTPSQLKLRDDRELGAIVGLFIMFIYTIIFIIIFVWIDYDITDFIPTIKFRT